MMALSMALKPPRRTVLRFTVPMCCSLLPRDQCPCVAPYRYGGRYHHSRSAGSRRESSEDPVHPREEDEDEDDVVERIPDGLQDNVQDVYIGHKEPPGKGAYEQKNEGDPVKYVLRAQVRLLLPQVF